MKKKLPNLGDVISSAKFAFGYHPYSGQRRNKKIILVDGKTEKYPIEMTVSEESRLRTTAKIGKIPPRTVTLELGAHDPSRATAKFVVEKANMEGGGTGHGAGDVYPDGWHVEARRLNEDGTYNPKGEVILFYMSGCFTNTVEMKDIQIVSKMDVRAQFA